MHKGLHEVYSSPCSSCNLRTQSCIYCVVFYIQLREASGFFLLWFTMGPERLRAKAQTDSEATLCHLCGIVCLKAALLIRCIVFMISVSLHLLSDL